MASILLCYIALASALIVIPDAHGYQDLSYSNGRYISQLYENFYCPFQDFKVVNNFSSNAVEFGVLTMASNVSNLRPVPFQPWGDFLSSTVNYYAAAPNSSYHPTVTVEDQLVEVFDWWIIGSQPSSPVQHVYIFTYYSPCVNCASNLSNLANNFPNISFHIGYFKRFGELSALNGIFEPRQNIFFGDVSGYCSDPSARGDTTVCSITCDLQASWSEWAEYESCSRTCGGGLQTRQRTCYHGYLSNHEAPGQCSGPASESQNCSTQQCPSWGAWTEYGSCSKTCGSGNKTRRRTCYLSNNEAPEQCSGPASESQSCNINPCPSWGEWAEYGSCSRTCGSGNKTRQRTCYLSNNEAPEHCSGPSSESQSCNTQPCPSWGEWAEYGSCSRTCGGGDKTRQRTCYLSNNEAPEQCSGPSSESQSCNTQPCPSWGEWTQYGSCRRTCGGGYRTRQRTCYLSNNEAPGQCSGPASESQSCNTQSCPSWGAWARYGSCSRTCGNGNRSRQRTCNLSNNEAPGQCSGQASQSQSCNTQSCPYWGSWGSWCECCSGESGTQYRYRTCYGGSCSGQNRQTQSCHCDESCFASDSMVRVKIPTKNGVTIERKRMDQLKVGDHVESFDPETKSVAFSEVYFISHEDETHNSSLLLKLVVGLDNGKELSLRLTSKHLVYACHSEEKYDTDTGLVADSCRNPPMNPVTAESVKVGDILWVRNSAGEFSPRPVIDIGKSWSGVRHPMTLNHYIVVDDVLASVHMFDEGLYRQVTAPLKFLYGISPSITNTGLVKQLVKMWDHVEENLL